MICKRSTDKFLGRCRLNRYRIAYVIRYDMFYGRQTIGKIRSGLINLKRLHLTVGSCDILGYHKRTIKTTPAILRWISRGKYGGWAVERHHSDADTCRHILHCLWSLYNWRQSKGYLSGQLLVVWLQTVVFFFN